MVELRNSDLSLGIAFAKGLRDAADHEWPALVERFRRERRLSKAIRQINCLLNDDHAHELAHAALRRIGLEYGG